MKIRILLMFILLSFVSCTDDNGPTPERLSNTYYVVNPDTNQQEEFSNMYIEIPQEGQQIHMQQTAGIENTSIVLTIYNDNGEESRPIHTTYESKTDLEFISIELSTKDETIVPATNVDKNFSEPYHYLCIDIKPNETEEYKFFSISIFPHAKGMKCSGNSINITQPGTSSPRIPWSKNKKS